MIFSVFCIYKSIIILYIKKCTHINIIHFWKVCSVEICVKLGVPSPHLNRTHFSGSTWGARQVKPASLTLSFLPASPTPRPRVWISPGSCLSHRSPPSAVSLIFLPFTKPLCSKYCYCTSSPNAETQRGWIIPKGHTASAHGAGPGRLKQWDCGPVFTASLDVG